MSLAISPIPSKHYNDPRLHNARIQNDDTAEHLTGSSFLRRKDGFVPVHMCSLTSIGPTHNRELGDQLMKAAGSCAAVISQWTHLGSAPECWH